MASKMKVGQGDHLIERLHQVEFSMLGPEQFPSIARSRDLWCSTWQK